MVSISNNSSGLAKFITTMTTKDAKPPIVALEATVVAGRTYQAYKRGKGDEARERFLEEVTGSIVWLWGVEVLNKFGDELLKKLLDSKQNFDVGTDKVLRTPFKNFMRQTSKGFSEGQVALLKCAKVASSILLANLFIGFVVPKVNHYITNTIRHNKHELEIEHANDSFEASTNKDTASNPSFKGGFAAMNAFTNAIENTNTGKLLSTDFGIAGGRMYNARSNEERREIAFRDLGSIYFYMWAQGHVRDAMNFAETGNFSRLNPKSAKTLSNHLTEFIKNNGEMSVEEFKKAVLGKKAAEITLPENIPFEVEELSLFKKAMNKISKSEPLSVAKVDDLKKFFSDKELLDRIERMSKLQPERMGKAVITKQQLIDAINDAKINNPEFLKNAFNEFTKNASSDPFKFVSDSEMRSLKKQMEDFVEQLCKSSKDGKITEDLIKKAYNKNILFNTINFAAGFSVAALFLSTFIPKIQYYITRKSTGVDAFPGTYDFNEHSERPC